MPPNVKQQKRMESHDRRCLLQIWHLKKKKKKLDKRLTWNTHIKETDHIKRQLALTKKLAGTDWGANSKILKQIYTGYVRPVMKYGSATWSTASKSNTHRLSTVQNAGMRIITGELKTTPIAALETTKLAPLDERREKILAYHAKIQRMPICLHTTYSKQEQKTDLKGQASITYQDN
jgi:hypothetical protein